MSAERKSQAQSGAFFPVRFEASNSIDLSVKNAGANAAPSGRRRG
jgi:hypothetical protein